ncbi:MAG: hypothetical protein EAZ85_10750 [Bacteroidetes bacterium]|nr:MAG: hypothetical protein EAZ85_10750 [Bacteroidota bacterium]TAG95339.1 MAG: hypothetical protein EAZ20_00355 [Bacteroidota bacterium]
MHTKYLNKQKKSTKKFFLWTFFITFLFFCFFFRLFCFGFFLLFFSSIFSNASFGTYCRAKKFFTHFISTFLCFSGVRISIFCLTCWFSFSIAINIFVMFVYVFGFSSIANVIVVG